ncbi:MAG: C4-type zinc ribbon domain-containing protein [Phycisphaerales bacterium]
MSLIANLRALHLVDSQVRGIRTRIENAERELKRQQTQLDTLTQQRREQDLQLKHLQSAVLALELEDKTFKQRIDHLRGELNTTSNSKQYNALRDELMAMEGKRDELAERVLAQMENVEKMKKQIGAGEQPLADRTRLRDLARAALEEATREFGGRLGELEAQRERAASLLAPDAREAFDEAAEQNDGEALAEITVVDLRHREFACGGCNSELPLDKYSKVAAQRDDVVTCVNCGRILYLDTIPETTAVKKRAAKEAGGAQA